MSIRDELLAFDGAYTSVPESLAFDSQRHFDVDGRLHVIDCKISAARVNPYWGREIPDWQELGLRPDKIYRLWRHPEELAKAADSFTNVQVLDMHIGVNASSPKLERTCGTVGKVYWEAPFLKARQLTIWTDRAIRAIETEKTAELSSSYRYVADMTAGVTPEGVAYDGIMRHIMANHVALVEEGRAGPDVCVADHSLEDSMKYAELINFLKTGGYLARNANVAALDRALDKRAARDESEEDPEEAMDAREEEVDKREEALDEKEDDKEKAKDRKRARDSRKAARDGRKAARDAKRAKDAETPEEKVEEVTKHQAKDAVAALDAAIQAGTVVSADEVARRVKLAEDAAVARVNAIAQAKENVKPLVGVVTAAMDSAEAVYVFALDQIQAPHEGVTGIAALSALVAAEVRARKAPTLRAQDAAPKGTHSFTDIFGVR